MARLRRADCGAPGIGRRRHGRGFIYVDTAGKRVRDAEVLDRIRGLVIPPAWRDVWICPHPNGHIQAVGVDAAGRKQYLYHPRWRQRRDQEKFDRMVEFARALPRVRRITSEHLSRRGLPRERVLACAVRLLDRGFFRIGGEDYAEENETFGLATMRKDHVSLPGPGRVAFEYTAKGGIERIHSIVAPDVYEVVQKLKRRRLGGPELLAYKDGASWRDVRSADINQYLKQVAGGEYSAKDFRTWHATQLAAVALAVSAQASRSRTRSKRAIARAVAEVAFYLGNTPAISRKSYIDPRVIDRFVGGVTIAGVLEDIGSTDPFSDPAFQGPVEEAVLDLIQGTESPAIEKAV